MGPLISRLVEIFIRFPGIGPRQARRFVYFLLQADKNFVDNLIEAIKSARADINECNVCHRYFADRNQEICDLCRDSNRDDGTLMVIEKDADLEAVQKAGSYSGRYFVLGGLIPLTEKSPAQAVRLNELQTLVKSKLAKGLKEIILAFSVSTEGDHTSELVTEALSKVVDDKVQITILGRGLSTGTELEYSDSATLQSAISHREPTN